MFELRCPPQGQWTSFQNLADLMDAWGTIRDKAFRSWRPIYPAMFQNTNVDIDFLKIRNAHSQEIVILSDTHIYFLKDVPVLDSFRFSSFCYTMT